jgi:hypothetical protein
VRERDHRSRVKDGNSQKKKVKIYDILLLTKNKIKWPHIYYGTNPNKLLRNIEYPNSIKRFKKQHEDTDTRERERERERESDRLEIGDLIVRQTGRPPLSERCSSYSLCKLRKKKKREKTHPHLKTMIYSYYQKTICYACVCVCVCVCVWGCYIVTTHANYFLTYPRDSFTRQEPPQQTRQTKEFNNTIVIVIITSSYGALALFTLKKNSIIKIYLM